MLLYDNPMSGNCYKARLLLALLGIAYERRELSVIDRSDRAEVLGELNPGLRVPTLVLDDGRALGESGAILLYLAEDTEYLPKDRFERAQMLQWMFFEQYSHEPNIAVLRFWAEAGIEPSATELEAKRAGGEAALAAMDRHLTERRFFVADAYSLADIALYAYTHVAHEGGFSLDPYPAIGAWLARVAAPPPPPSAPPAVLAPTSSSPAPPPPRPARPSHRSHPPPSRPTSAAPPPLAPDRPAQCPRPSRLKPPPPYPPPQAPHPHHPPTTANRPETAQSTVDLHLFSWHHQAARATETPPPAPPPSPLYHSIHERYTGARPTPEHADPAENAFLPA